MTRPARDVRDRGRPEERQQVVLAQRVERDVLDDDHLAVVDVEDRVVDEPLGVDVIAGGQLGVHPVDALRACRPGPGGPGPRRSPRGSGGRRPRPGRCRSSASPAWSRPRDPVMSSMATLVSPISDLDLVDEAADVRRQVGRSGHGRGMVRRAAASWRIVVRGRPAAAIGHRIDARRPAGSWARRGGRVRRRRRAVGSWRRGWCRSRRGVGAAVGARGRRGRRCERSARPWVARSAGQSARRSAGRSGRPASAGAGCVARRGRPAARGRRLACAWPDGTTGRGDRGVGPRRRAGARQRSPGEAAGRAGDVGRAPDAVAPATHRIGRAETGGTATSSGAPGPDGGGTVADRALARTIAMSSPKPIPTAVWR